MAIPAVYDKVLDGFSYGAACVSKGGEVGLIDKEGKAVIPFTKTLQEMWKLDEEHIAFKEKGKWGFMDVKEIASWNLRMTGSAKAVDTLLFTFDP